MLTFVVYLLATSSNTLPNSGKLDQRHDAFWDPNFLQSLELAEDQDARIFTLFPGTLCVPKG